MTVILSLGDVVTQNQLATVSQFASFIDPVNPQAKMPVLDKILQSKAMGDLLKQFKTGQISEEAFLIDILKRIEENTGVALSKEQFYAAWNAMNPSSSSFISRLNEVAMHRDVIFVSETNPIDMAHLKQELQKENIPFTTDEENNLTSLAGIPLYLSYVHKQPKESLILTVIEKLKKNSLNPEQLYFHPWDIKYMLSDRSIPHEQLEKLNQESKETVSEALETKGIATLVWHISQGEKFAEAIKSENIYHVPVAKL
ncbi:hypothetical protein [Legionella maceachernii]|uniref:Uncharacterized protein n=1 Tax=Legionella maceachernii TaxID=466 RepID=A0A0W0VWY7_9GAMM|nr:hypothetical protein [Legionella maceachernii]KTD24430.1 hypothetical protein Lmac_2517 [Legionella maceachernii]SJZ67070.1 hypothetical protein SAMN02745128_00716 [Legionella maceachernii]SUP02009.1 Uncharacterised protein [Legionella maceachernii]